MLIHNQRSNSEAGFTLIEVIVVIVLLGILAGTVINGILFILQRDRAEAVASELAGWLIAVRRAGERGSGCDVTIVPGNSYNPGQTIATVAASNPTNVTNPCGFVAVIPPTGPAASFRVASAPVTTFTFTPRGTVFIDGVNNDPVTIGVNTVRGGTAVLPTRCVRITPPLGLIEVVPNSGNVVGQCP